MPPPASASRYPRLRTSATSTRRDGDLEKLADLLGGDTFLSSDSSDFVPSDTYAPGTVSPTGATSTAPVPSRRAPPPTALP